MRRLGAVCAVLLTATACGATQSGAPVSGSPSPASASTSPGPVLLTLSTPTDGASVHGAFTVTGTSNSFEANTPWSLTNAAGTKVKVGSFTATGWGDHLYPYTGHVSVAGLPAGSYVFTVRLDDPSDGEGGPVQTISRSVVVH